MQISDYLDQVRSAYASGRSVLPIRSGKSYAVGMRLSIDAIFPRLDIPVRKAQRHKLGCNRMPAPMILRP